MTARRASGRLVEAWLALRSKSDIVELPVVGHARLYRPSAVVAPPLAKLVATIHPIMAKYISAEGRSVRPATRLIVANY